MQLLVSVSKWGTRKVKDVRIGGLYLVDFERKAILNQLEIPVESNATRALGGVVINGDVIFAAHPKDIEKDSILIIDRGNFSVIAEKFFDRLSDVHQIDIFDDILWVTNTNYNEVVAISLDNWAIVGTWCIDKTQEQERYLQPSNQKAVDRDHRGRIHLNSILIRKGFLDVGCFGIDKGKFNSSQLTRVQWSKDGKYIKFGKQINLPLSGFISPHNAMFLSDGEKLVCNSFHGSLIVGNKEIQVGGWTRGVAISEEHIYVGRSSHSYQESHGAENNDQTDAQIAVFKIARSTMQIEDEFLFSKWGSLFPFGQIYDIRIVDNIDFATSLMGKNGVSIPVMNSLKKTTLKEPKFNPGEWENLQGNIEEALQSFKKAVEINPNLASVHNNLGVCYWQREEFENAIDHFQKALELDPDDSDILSNYTKVLISFNKVEDAKELFSDYLKRNPAGDEEISSLLVDFNPPHYMTIESKQKSFNIPTISLKDLHKKLGVNTPINYPQSSLIKPLAEWKMEIDDSPILMYIYRHFRPRRHLEFGTWQGMGTLYCLEESDATVWTINPPFGEDRPDGDAAYGHEESELPSVRLWAKKVGFGEKDSYKTDTIGFIGRFYLEKEMGHRVCQVYCDSRKWETSNYPADFFDTVLIDGGHAKDVVINDTLKALQLTRPGGIIMWHDFCPPVWDRYETTIGVTEAVLEIWDWIQENTSQIFWIYPSYILLGVKAHNGNVGFESVPEAFQAVFKKYDLKLSKKGGIKSSSQASKDEVETIEPKKEISKSICTENQLILSVYYRLRDKIFPPDTRRRKIAKGIRDFLRNRVKK